LRRLELIGLAAPLGLATGLAAWLLAGGLSVRANTLDDIQARLARLRPPAAAPSRAGEASAAPLLSAPLFALTTGPGAVREPSIRLDGVALTRRRLAALLSIDSRPAEWLVVGETREGVTLQAVSASEATVETLLGPKSLNLGDQSAASAPAPSSPGPSASAVVQDQVPPGFRSPPEPASAPGPR
jgi:hypothetical protein